MAGYRDNLRIILIVFFSISSLFFSQFTLFSKDFFTLKKSIINNAWKKIGFIYIKPALILENMGYTSNIFSYEDLAEPDWQVDAGVDISFSSILGKRFIIVVKEAPSYSFYLNNKEQENFNNILNAEIYTYFGRFNLNYRYSEQTYKTRPTSEFGPRIIVYNRNNSVAVDYGRYDNLFINLYLEENINRHRDKNYIGEFDLSGSMDRRIVSAGIKINKAVFTRTLLVLNGEYYNYKFDYEQARDGWGGKASIGILFPEISSIKGDLKFGINYFRPDNPFAEEYSKPFGSGNVSIKLLRRFRFRINYLIDNFYSFWREDLYFDQRSFTAGVEYYFNKKIKAGYSFHSGVLIYRYLSGDYEGRKDNFESSVFKFGYRISGNMEIGIKYTKYFSDSNVSDFKRNYNFIGGYLSHDF